MIKQRFAAVGVSFVWLACAAAGEPATGAVPEDLMQRLRDDLAQRLGDAGRRATEEIRVLRAEEVVWRDGSMGCPQRGAMYTHALIEGYHVILEHAGQQFDYRSDRRGRFQLCERPPLRLRPPDDRGEPPTE